MYHPSIHTTYVYYIVQYTNHYFQQKSDKIKLLWYLHQKKKKKKTR